MDNNTKKRIAFCFSGQARTLDQTYLFFKKNLFDTAKEQGFDYDVFCAVEDDKDVNKIFLLHPTKVIKIKSSDAEKVIDEKYGDFVWLYNSYCILYCYNKLLLKSASKRYLQQYYKVKKSIELKSDFEKTQGFTYNLVFRLRFDCVFENKFNFIKILQDIKGNIILCEKLTNRKFTLCPIADFFFIGSSETMDVFGKHFNNFKESFTGHEINFFLKPILYLFRLVDYVNYKLHNFFITNYLVRVLGIINTKLFFHSYCAEMIIYDYLIYNKIRLIRNSFSFRIIRNNSGNNIEYLFNISIYEK